MAGELVSVGTMNPEEVKKQLTDPKSKFFQESGLAQDSPLVKQLLKLADSRDPAGHNESSENLNVHLAKDLGIDVAALKKLGRGVDRLWLMVTVQDSKGKPRLLDSPEFIAWQSSVKGFDGKDLPHGGRPGEAPDAWAARIHVSLKSHADEPFTSHLGAGAHLRGAGRRRAGDPEAGGQDVAIENPTGTKRIVAAGRILTEPFGSNYGNERILDAAKDSPAKGKPILVGKDGELDVFIPDSVLKDIDKGKRYSGPVLVKSRGEMQGDKEVCDPKVFYLSDPKQAILSEAKGFGGKKRSVSELSGVKFDPPVELPGSFVEYNERDKASYVAMTNAQYQAWKFDLSENVEARTMRPEKWIEKKWGSRALFDKAVEGAAKDGVLTRDQYHEAMKQNKADKMQGKIDSMAKNKDQSFADLNGSALSPLATGALPRGSRSRC